MMYLVFVLQMVIAIAQTMPSVATSRLLTQRKHSVQIAVNANDDVTDSGKRQPLGTSSLPFQRNTKSAQKPVDRWDSSSLQTQTRLSISVVKGQPSPEVFDRAYHSFFVSPASDYGATQPAAELANSQSKNQLIPHVERLDFLARSIPSSPSSSSAVRCNHGGPVTVPSAHETVLDDGDLVNDGRVIDYVTGLNQFAATRPPLFEINVSDVIGTGQDWQAAVVQPATSSGSDRMRSAPTVVLNLSKNSVDLTTASVVSVWNVGLTAAVFFGVGLFVPVLVVVFHLIARVHLRGLRRSMASGDLL